MRMWFLFAVAALVGVAAGVAAAIPTFDSVAGRFSAAHPPQKAVDADVAPPLPAPDAPQPRVVVDQELFDFGAADAETKGSHVFTFTNAGEGDLVLAQGKTTCKCTISKLDNKPIPPGGSATVTLEWTVRATEMMQEEFRQEAVIWTNDRQRDHVTLVIRGKISRSLVVTPPDVAFGTLVRSSDESRTVHVYCQLAEPFEIRSWTLTNQALVGNFDVALRPLAPAEFTLETARSGYELTVRAKPGLPLGALQQTIRLETNIATAPTYVLPVTGFVDSDFRILGENWSPRTRVLDMGTLNRGESRNRKLSIRVAGPRWRDVRLEAPASDIPGLKVTLGERTETDAAALYALVVEAPGDLPPMTHLGKPQSPYGTITIKTTDPETPVLELRVEIVVK